MTTEEQIEEILMEASAVGLRWEVIEAAKVYIESYDRIRYHGNCLPRL
jgi:hypothetical protein